MLAAAVLAALAVWLAWDVGDHRLVTRLGSVAAAEAAQGGPGARRGAGVARRGGWLAAGAGCLVLGGAFGHRGVALALLALIAAGASMTMLGRAKRRGRADAERRAVARATQVLAGLLRVGAIPATALATVAAEQPVLADADALQQVGGDVVAALRRGSRIEGREGLADLAAAWEVAARTGASLCDSIDAVASELARREESERTVRVELAAARMAGRVLAVLPLVGLLIGYALGGDPVGFLVSGVAGEVCLVVAAALTASGLLWLDALAEKAMR